MFDRHVVSLFLPRIEKLFSEMDLAYSEASSAYGFICSGCSDNCCEERFFHYTLIEQLILTEGLYTISKKEIAGIFKRSAETLERYAIHDPQSSAVRVMCPLNTGRLCMLYKFRPMICRLHGIPHIVRKEGGREQKFPGCGEFEQGKKMDKRAADYVFDRTVLYGKMAALEIDLRKALNFRGDVRKTVAEIIKDFRNGMAPPFE